MAHTILFEGKSVEEIKEELLGFYDDLDSSILVDPRIDEAMKLIYHEHKNEINQSRNDTSFGAHQENSKTIFENYVKAHEALDSPTINCLEFANTCESIALAAKDVENPDVSKMKRENIFKATYDDFVNSSVDSLDIYSKKKAGGNLSLIEEYIYDHIELAQKNISNALGEKRLDTVFDNQLKNIKEQNGLNAAEYNKAMEEYAKAYDLIKDGKEVPEELKSFENAARKAYNTIQTSKKIIETYQKYDADKVMENHDYSEYLLNNGYQGNVFDELANDPKKYKDITKDLAGILSKETNKDDLLQYTTANLSPDRDINVPIQLKQSYASMALLNQAAGINRLDDSFNPFKEATKPLDQTIKASIAQSKALFTEKLKGLSNEQAYEKLFAGWSTDKQLGMGMASLAATSTSMYANVLDTVINGSINDINAKGMLFERNNQLRDIHVPAMGFGDVDLSAEANLIDKLAGLKNPGDIFAHQLGEKVAECSPDEKIKNLKGLQSVFEKKEKTPEITAALAISMREAVKARGGFFKNIFHLPTFFTQRSLASKFERDAEEAMGKQEFADFKAECQEKKENTLNSFERNNQFYQKDAKVFKIKLDIKKELAKTVVKEKETTKVLAVEKAHDKELGK